jgi:uncharacterized membrane protein YdbT with pleckstrin-like domain
MASYTNLTLQPGEKILRVAHLHFVIYATAMFYVTLAGVVAGLAYTTIGFNKVSLLAISALLAVAFRHAAHAWWRQFTTELCITTKRVVNRTGFISRETQEMFLTNIESVFVQQSILGRLLNYGDIHCRGNGEGIEHLDYIADPIAVQTAINSN